MHAFARHEKLFFSAIKSVQINIRERERERRNQALTFFKGKKRQVFRKKSKAVCFKESHFFSVFVSFAQQLQYHNNQSTNVALFLIGFSFFAAFFRFFLGSIFKTLAKPNGRTQCVPTIPFPQKSSPFHIGEESGVRSKKIAD